MKSAEFFKKTKESSNQRRELYLKYAKEPESKLLHAFFTSNNVVSMSQFYPNLKTYEPEIKNKHEIFTLVNNDDSNSPCPTLIPPASSGEESLCISEDQEKHNKRVLSLKEICSYLIDSSLLKIEKPMPKYINITHLLDSVDSHYYSRKTPVVSDKPRELLFWDIEESLDDERVIYEHLKEVFSVATGEKVKLHVSRIRFLFFKGKYSTLIRFGDPETAAYLYFNFSNSIKPKTRDILGNNFLLYYVVENNLKAKKTDWIAVVMRGLNQNIEKEHIVTRLKEKLNLNPVWVEELVTIKHHKYALFGVNSIEEAENVCKHFKNSTDIKHKIKANIHPRSSKIRKLVPNKFKKFLIYQQENEFLSDHEQIKVKKEAENLKEQLMQKVLDLKSAGRLVSSATAVTNSLPDLINAFNLNDIKAEDQEEIITKDEKSVKKEEESEKISQKSHKRTHSRPKNYKHHQSFYVKSNYYNNSREIYKEKHEKNEKTQHSNRDDISYIYKSKKNRSRSRTRSHNKSKTRSFNKSLSKHKEASRSKSRSRDRKSKKIFYKHTDMNKRMLNEKIFKRNSRSKSRKDRSRSKTSNDKFKFSSKPLKNESKFRKYSKSRSNSIDKNNNKGSYYKKRNPAASPSYEKRYKKNDPKENYRKKYLHNIDNLKDKDNKDREENNSSKAHSYSNKNYKSSYHDSSNFEKYNNNRIFEKFPNNLNNMNIEENLRKLNKPSKGSILERIKQGHHPGSKENKEINIKYEESSHYRQKYSIYDEYNAFNEEKEEGNIEEEIIKKEENIEEEAERKSVHSKSKSNT